MEYLDLDGEIEVGSVLVPEDTYEVSSKRVDFVDVGGTPNLVIHWVVLEGEWQGTEIPDFYAMTTKALFRLRNLLRALDLVPKGERVSFKVGDLPVKLEGLTATIDVTIEEYEGVERNKVRVVNGQRLA